MTTERQRLTNLLSTICALDNTSKIVDFIS